MTEQSDVNEYTQTQIECYRELAQVADRLGLDYYRRGVYFQRLDRRSRGYTITPLHHQLIEAMTAALEGKLTPEWYAQLVERAEIEMENLKNDVEVK